MTKPTRFYRVTLVWTDALVAAHGGDKVQTRDFDKAGDALNYVRALAGTALESFSIITVN